jgi:hypothetical protein
METCPPSSKSLRKLARIEDSEPDDSDMETCPPSSQSLRKLARIEDSESDESHTEDRPASSSEMALNMIEDSTSDDSVTYSSDTQTEGDESFDSKFTDSSSDDEDWTEL